MATLSPHMLAFQRRWVLAYVPSSAHNQIPSVPGVSKRILNPSQPGPDKRGRAREWALPSKIRYRPLRVLSLCTKLCTSPFPPHCSWGKLQSASLHIHLKCQPWLAMLGCFQGETRKALIMLIQQNHPPKYYIHSSCILFGSLFPFLVEWARRHILIFKWSRCPFSSPLQQQWSWCLGGVQCCFEWAGLWNQPLLPIGFGSRFPQFH